MCEPNSTERPVSSNVVRSIASSGAPVVSSSSPASPASAARADRLARAVQRDADGPHHPVQAGGFELCGVAVEEFDGEMVTQPGHRFVVGVPEPFDEPYVRPLGDPERGGDLGGGRFDRVAQHAGGGALAGRLQVVVEAAQLQRSSDLAVQDLGADAPAAYQQTLVDERLDGLADGRPGEPEPARQLDLVAEEAARREPALLDGGFELLRQLEVERDRAGAVDTEPERGGLRRGGLVGRSARLLPLRLLGHVRERSPVRC